MPAIYEFQHTLESHEIDPLGHASNVAYIEWMQAAALAHSAAQGWPADRYRALGVGWVVRAHTIEYLRPAWAGETIVVRTWVATMRKATSTRRYQIRRQSDGTLLAAAETRWAFVDYTSNQPIRIPREIADAFEVVNDEE